MKRKNIPLYLAVIALSMMASCSSTKPGSENAPRSDSTQTVQLKERERQCAYTQQEAYSSLWEKNQSQQNLIESLKKRITMLEVRLNQENRDSTPIPNMVVEPHNQPGNSKPFENCMNQRTVKKVEQLQTENKKQAAEIVELHRKAADLTLKLQSNR
jgi:hypothetical protein